MNQLNANLPLAQWVAELPDYGQYPEYYPCIITPAVQEAAGGFDHETLVEIAADPQAFLAKYPWMYFIPWCDAKDGLSVEGFDDILSTPVVTPTPSISPAPTPSSTPTPSATPTPTVTPMPTNTPAGGLGSSDVTNTNDTTTDVTVDNDATPVVTPAVTPTVLGAATVQTGATLPKTGSSAAGMGLVTLLGTGAASVAYLRARRSAK
jgi:hypothetical protein